MAKKKVIRKMSKAVTTKKLPRMSTTQTTLADGSLDIRIISGDHFRGVVNISKEGIHYQKPNTKVPMNGRLSWKMLSNCMRFTDLK